MRQRKTKQAESGGTGASLGAVGEGGEGWCSFEEEVLVF